MKPVYTCILTLASSRVSRSLLIDTTPGIHFKLLDANLPVAADTNQALENSLLRSLDRAVVPKLFTLGGSTVALHIML